MAEEYKIRFGWLKFMYIYTIVGAGGFGLGLIIMPEVIKSSFKFPSQDPVILGIASSYFVGSGILSILGLRSPLKFVPLLVLQLFYKCIWLVGIISPLLITGEVPTHAVILIIIFVTYIIGDLIAIPFGYVFSKEQN